MKMDSKFKSIILFLTLIGMALGVFSFISLKEYSPTEIFYQELYPPGIIAALLLIYIFLPKKLKINRKFLNLSALTASILLVVLTGNLVKEHYVIKRTEKIMTEYLALDCEKMQERFQTDLEQNQLKFFWAGMFGPGESVRKFKKHNIEVFETGCQVYSNFECCYNKLIYNHLKEQKGVNLFDLYEWLFDLKHYLIQQ